LAGAEAAGNGYIRRVMAGMKPIANDAGIRDWQAKRHVARRLRSSQCLGLAGRNQQRAPSGKGDVPAEINSIETRCASAYRPRWRYVTCAHEKLDESLILVALRARRASSPSLSRQG